MNKSFDRGSSIIQVLVSLGLAAILVMILLEITSTQIKETKHLQEKLATLDVERQLILALRDGAVCTAELTDSTLNPSAPYTFNANPADLPNAKLVLPRLHTLPLPSSPFIVSTGSFLSTMTFSAKVQEIAIKDFVDSGLPDFFNANLTVTIDPAFLVRAIAPIQLQINIQTDPATPLSAKRVVSCLVGNSNTQPCPANFSRVGDPGTNSSFCIMTSPQTNAGFFAAKNVCLNQSFPVFGFAHLCTQNEYYATCKKNGIPVLANMPPPVGEWHWVDDSMDNDNWIVMGNNNCDGDSYGGTGATGVGSSLKYYCCVK
jgi:hypothetical protein